MILNLFYTLLTQTGRTIGSLIPNGSLKRNCLSLVVLCSFLLSHHLTHQTKLMAFLRSVLQNIQ